MTENTNKSKKDITIEDDISLKELFVGVQKTTDYLISKWKIIVLAIIFGGMLGLLYSVLRKSTYTATLSFVLDDQKAGSGGLSAYAGIASQFGFNIGGTEGQGLFSGDNIMEFLKSRRMIQQTLLTPVELDGKNELLVDRYVAFSNFNKKWDKNPKLIDFTFKADRLNNFIQDSLIKEIYSALLKKHLVIGKPDKKLNILSIEVESPDELFSKAFSETLLKNVSVEYTKTVTKKASENVAVLSKMADSVRYELNTAIGGVASAQQAYPNANIALQSLKVPSQKRTVDVQANTAIFGELVKQLELARMTLRNERPLIQVLDQPILPLDKNRVGKVKGMILGGFVGGLLTILVLLGKAFYRSIMGENN